MALRNLPFKTLNDTILHRKGNQMINPKSNEKTLGKAK